MPQQSFPAIVRLALSPNGSVPATLATPKCNRFSLFATLETATAVLQEAASELRAIAAMALKNAVTGNGFARKLQVSLSHIRVRSMRHAFKSSDLAPEAKIAVERLLGRALESDEAVELSVLKLDELINAQSAARRREAASKIRELSRRKKLDGITVKALINEDRRF
jgi:hypothetical protein